MLTNIIAAVFLLTTIATSAMSLWRKRLSEAFIGAGAFFGTLHLAMAWKAASGALQAEIANIEFSCSDSSPEWPAISLMPQWVYDTTAAAAMVFIAIGSVLCFASWRKKRQEI